MTFDGGGPLALTIPQSVGSAATTKVVTMNAAIEKISGSSPNACIVGTTQTEYTYLELFNPTNLTATVSVWLNAAPGGTSFDSLLAAYPGAMNPPSNRAMCVNFNDDCGALAPCDSNSLMSGLINSGADNRVVLGPGASVTLYIAEYSGTTMQNVQVSARTDILQ
jgi:hypothetical protein